jgi:2-haloacid dehalogenase
MYGAIEAETEHEPYRRYRAVLEEVVRRMALQLGFEASAAECAALPESLAQWPAFPDSAAALAKLHTRFGLAVLSNVDDDLFAASATKLGNPFDLLVTAQQVGSYKPAEANFRALLARLAERGIRPDELLHVAQSRFHDIAPARSLGLATVWVNRYGIGAGATPAADAVPDLEVPSLAALAERIPQLA